jgi:hypothetical protein
MDFRLAGWQFSFGTMGIFAPSPTAHYHGSSNRDRGADKMIRLRVVEMSDWARSFVSEFLVLSPCAPALTALERAPIMRVRLCRKEVGTDAD